MARFKDREKALALRKQEMSYSQIKAILGVGKGTLSAWLKDYPLSREKINQLSWKNEKRIERYRETRRQTKEKRLKEFYLKEKKEIFPLNKRDFFIAGLFLYWGEGSKILSKEVSVSNTDPSMVNFFIDWAVNHLKIPREKIRIALHLYNDMDINKEIKFWSNKLNIPKNQFSKPYIKQSSIKAINYKRGFGHGTCNARINDARLSEKVLMGIKSISDAYENSRL
ncbi:MAG: helix-turn-helix domain-containing protein [bacterium]